MNEPARPLAARPCQPSLVTVHVPLRPLPAPSRRRARTQPYKCFRLCLGASLLRATRGDPLRGYPTPPAPGPSGFPLRTTSPSCPAASPRCAAPSTLPGTSMPCCRLSLGTLASRPRPERGMLRSRHHCRYAPLRPVSRTLDPATLSTASPYAHRFALRWRLAPFPVPLWDCRDLPVSY